MTIIAWHFTGDRLRDGSPIPQIGEWLEYTGKVEICKSGLHASRDPFDALQFAPGPMLHKVECDQIVDEEEDKFVCLRRRIIASRDATEGLRYFARMRALSVVHLWSAPDVVLDFLMTGNPVIAAAAWAAADTARAAARAAAWAAADATWDASAATWAASDATWDASAAARAASDAADAAAAARDAARKEWNALVKEAFE